MPQQKRNGSGSGRKSSGSARGSSASASAARRSAASKGRSSSPSKTRSGAGGQHAAQRRAAPRSSAPSDDARAGFAIFRELLQRAMEGQMHLVMLSNERIQEVMDDAVARGRVTRDDAEELVQEMVRRGRQQTSDLLAELEQLMGRGRDQLETAATAARRSPPADRVLREVDRARRVAGIGHSFPILSYEDLTAAQVADRLDDLSPAELRKVRDYERRHGNRKSVLQAIESKLA
jgi:polyhydroxyalkanoate synthesis regulator phasin